MSHYECSNCGAHLGIDFGTCTSCTPREWFNLKTEQMRLENEGRATFDEYYADALADVRRLNDMISRRREEFAQQLNSERLSAIRDRLSEIERVARGGK